LRLNTGFGSLKGKKMEGGVEAESSELILCHYSVGVFGVSNSPALLIVE